MSLEDRAIENVGYNMPYLESVIEGVEEYVYDLLLKVKMGLYDEAQHGSLQDVLEEIERLLP